MPSFLLLLAALADGYELTNLSLSCKGGPEVGGFLTGIPDPGRSSGPARTHLQVWGYWGSWGLTSLSAPEAASATGGALGGGGSVLSCFRSHSRRPSPNQVIRPLQQCTSPTCPVENVCPTQSAEWLPFPEAACNVFPLRPSQTAASIHTDQNCLDVSFKNWEPLYCIPATYRIL